MAMMTNEFCVRMISMPPNVHGATIFDVDGFANIYSRTNIRVVEND